jgi:SAM-dependent methyltransferase
MTDKSANPAVILDSKGDEDSLEAGIYPCTVTRHDRYVNPESVDSIIYESLYQVLNSGESYRFLDIGSSSGEALDELAEKLEDEKDCSLETMALDINKEMAKQCYSSNADNVICAAGQDLPLQPESVDIVISSQLHLKPTDIEEVVDEINRVLDSEGYAVLSTGYGKENHYSDNINYRGIHKQEITDTSENPT